MIKTKFRTFNMAVDFFEKAKNTKFKKRFLQDQFDRALLSVVLNLAEGTGKPTAKDRRKFFYIALGSFREVQALLLVTDNKMLLKDSDSLGAHLYCLCKRT